MPHAQTTQKLVTSDTVKDVMILTSLCGRAVLCKPPHRGIYTSGGCCPSQMKIRNYSFSGKVKEGQSHFLLMDTEVLQLCMSIPWDMEKDLEIPSDQVK